MGTYTPGKLYKPAAGEIGWGTLVDSNLDYIDQHFINVKAMGALGDNATDDTAAFQAAIDLGTGATNSEPVILVPGGRYVINSTLNLGTKRVKFLGVGRPIYNDPRHGSAILTGTNAMTLFSIDAGATHNPQGPMFENLLLYDKLLGSTLVSINNTSRVTFRDCVFAANANTDGTTGWTSTFTAGQDASWHTIDNCTFYNLTNAIKPVKCLGAEVKGGSFVGCPTSIYLPGAAAHWRVYGVKMDGGAIVCLGAWNQFTSIGWEVQNQTAVQAFTIDTDGLGTTNSGQYNFVSGLTMNAAGGANVKGLLINTNSGFNSAVGVSANGFASSVNGCSNLSVTSNVYRLFEPPLIDLGAGPGIYTGNGAPGGVQSAPVGSYYLNLTSAGAGTCIYYKSSGSGSSGWVAIA